MTALDYSLISWLGDTIMARR